MSGRPALVYDIVLRVLDLHRARDDYGLLARCALVNWEWNRAASRVLYEHIVVAPRFNAVLDLRDKGAIPVSSNSTRRNDEEAVVFTPMPSQALISEYMLNI